LKILKTELKPAFSVNSKFSQKAWQDIETILRII